MFALRFRFPAGRYNATPWGRNVNEADVAWPPEPWRVLRALIAAYWRKGDRERWSKDDLGSLIDALAEMPPAYRLPKGAIHSHTRHYMPQARGNPKLVFDGFVRMPDSESIVVAWPDRTLEDDMFALASDLAAAIGYLGRAEGWTECEALADWRQKPNCGPMTEGYSGDAVQLMTPLSPAAYKAERDRLIADERRRLTFNAKKPLSGERLEAQVAKSFRSKAGGVDTLPEQLVDALAIDTADYQDRRWSRPPAGSELLYARNKEAALNVVSRKGTQPSRLHVESALPTVARFLLAGRPRPPIEDAIKIGELMRLAALAQFGWERDHLTGRSLPKAPPLISGRGIDGKPLRDPSHVHAYWLPEDADSDGLIDHVSVYVAAGIEHDVRVKLDCITRLWLERKQRSENDEGHNRGRQEWRLALEGFCRPEDFGGDVQILGRSARWQSVTPFLAAGHLKQDSRKKASEYAREFKRLVVRTGMDRRFEFDAREIQVSQLDEIQFGGVTRRAIHFHRFRSRGRQVQHDTMGVLLKVVFPVPIDGPLALGFGNHFGLGLFRRLDE